MDESTLIEVLQSISDRLWWIALWLALVALTGGTSVTVQNLKSD